MVCLALLPKKPLLELSLLVLYSMLTPATNTVPINISSPWLKTLSWLLFILTFKYDTPHAVKGDKSYDCESCHFASHNLDRFCNWCKPGSRKWESNDLSLAAMSHQISVTHLLCSRHILVRSTSRETYFLWFFSNKACLAGVCFFRAKGEISRCL